MTKSGSKKPKQLSETDASLIIIAVFCLSVVIFIGFNCCFKRGKRKNKAKQRKFGRKRGQQEQDDLLNESRRSEESLDCEGDDLSKSGHKSFVDNHHNHKADSPPTPPQNTTDSPPTPPQNKRGFLSRIMASLGRASNPTTDDDPEGSQKNDAKTANASKQGSSTSQRENSKKDNRKTSQKKKELDEKKQNESEKSRAGDSTSSKSKTSVKECSRTPTNINPLTDHSNKSAQGQKATKNNKYNKKHTNCTPQNSCKKCSAHIHDDDAIRGGNDSMESSKKGGPNTGTDSKGKGRKNQGDSFHDSMETGGDSTDRDKWGKGRGNPGDYSSGEYDSRRDRDSKGMGGSNAHRDKSGKEQGNSRDSWVEVAKDPGRQQDGGGGSMLTRSKAKDSEKTAVQGIRGSLDDGHGSLETDYDMCDEVEENIQKTDVEPTYANLPDDDDDMGKEEGREVEERDKKDEQNARSWEPPARNTTAREPETRGIESIGEVFNVIQYAMKEWKSDTQTAKDVRNGYREIPSQLGLNDLRVIRGDNYCAIRATLFQVLAQKIPILSQFKNIETFPRVLVGSKFDWINKWKFGSRLAVGRDKVCEEMGECLKELSNLVQLNAQMHQDESRVMHLLSNFNFKPIEYEIRLLEAVKFIMLYKAISLYQNLRQDKQVPVFAMIMFARDTSQNPEQFMMNHLNAVGDTGGLEQVEMHLLGYALGITIKVVRPSHVGQPDFIASYPEDMPSGTPVITLVAEDDRHYNILS